jgi:hypothetical protein
MVPLAFTSSGSSVVAAAAMPPSGRKTSLVVNGVAAGADSKTTAPPDSEIVGLASRRVESARVVAPVGPCTVIRPGGPPLAESMPNASRFDPNGAACRVRPAAVESVPPARTIR